MTEPRGMDRLRVAASYQFGAAAGEALFPAGESLDVERSRSGRPRQVIAEDGRIVTYATDGRFTLGFEGGRRLADGLEPPACRVEVGDESESFVRDGRNAFAKFVRDVDPEVRARDEVLVVDSEGTPLGVGRAELGADAMRDFESGVAVKIREGADE